MPERNADHPVVLVVPCYNEAERLDIDAFIGMIDANANIGVLFVDDGSSDGTAALHARAAQARPGRIKIHALPKNSGKAEAVRQGMQRALEQGAAVVGYLDADLATPVDEILRLVAKFHNMLDTDVLLGSRVKLLGRVIERRAVRHYVGRGFATAASLILRLPVYDTQCGAKLFRRSPTLDHALSEPFLTRWLFDVELLGRLVTGAPGVPAVSADRVCEEPLLKWIEVRGSKLGPHHFAVAVVDLMRVARDLARRRRLIQM
jgi:dolichyl-phosphate beta-glucosyltransferase